MDPINLVGLVLVGLAAGLLSGLFGIGGGVLIVPAVVLLLELDFREAVAISLFAITITTPIGLARYARAEKVRWRVGLLLGATGFVGVLTATFVDPFLSERGLMWMFAAFLLFASHRIAYGTGPLVNLGSDLRLALTGFAGGVVAKLLGIGGGILMVPALVLAGHPMHIAVATSLVAVWTNAFLSTGLNLWRIPGGWHLATIPVAAGSYVGIQLGSRWALRSQAQALQRAFAILLVLVSLLMVHRSLS